MMEWIEYDEFCDMVSENARAKHKVYLNSNEWKEKRERILKRDKHLCQDCLKISPSIFKELANHLEFIKNLNLDINIKAEQVHHLNYNSLHTKQEIDDCISLCENCHKIKHSGLKYDYKRNVQKRNESVKRIILLRLRQHPEIIKLNRISHDNFIKSLIIKPDDWLKMKLNEVENGRHN